MYCDSGALSHKGVGSSPGVFSKPLRSLPVMVSGKAMGHDGVLVRVWWRLRRYSWHRLSNVVDITIIRAAVLVPNRVTGSVLSGSWALSLFGTPFLDDALEFILESWVEGIVNRTRIED